MASLSLALPVKERTPHSATPEAEVPQEDVVLVAGFGDEVATDYGAYVSRTARADLHDGKPEEKRSVVRIVDLSTPKEMTAIRNELGRENLAAVVLFLRSQLTGREQRGLDELLILAVERRAEFVGVVSTFRVHLGDRDAAEAEGQVLEKTRELSARIAVFWPGFVLSHGARAGRWLRRIGFCFPLVPRRLRSCCVEGDDLFAAIETERSDTTPRRPRTFTLLGPNRPWRELLAERRAPGFLSGCLLFVSALLSLLLIGHLAGLVFALLARFRPALRCWNFDTLRPRSLHELLVLYNKYNHRHVRVVGYNNGVTHFGHRYPGKTVISTVLCDRIVRSEPDEIAADCGATIRKARDFLTGDGQDLYVIPNYSYVCLGTAFFVPIHGSAADYSCVADTISRVILYDPLLDRLVAATRDEPAFREHVYNPSSNALVLRLYLRVKDKSLYFVRREEWSDPSSAELLNALRDEEAANVEVRKSKASSAAVQVYKYYQDRRESPTSAIEVPRDSLGRLWDRLEENPVTSFLMHALTRHLAFHVELFFTAEEFATFWETHATLPLRKIQLRYIRRDGMPHSPFCRHDCVSADLFMFRRHRPAFEAYLKRTFAVVRTNPGKHSM